MAYPWYSTNEGKASPDRKAGYTIVRNYKTGEKRFEVRVIVSFQRRGIATFSVDNLADAAAQFDAKLAPKMPADEAAARRESVQSLAALAH